MSQSAAKKLTKAELHLRLIDLPEAELIRRELERELLGSGKTASTKRQKFPVINDVKIESKDSLGGRSTPKRFTDRVTGRKITRVGRQGRFLFLLLTADEKPDDVLVIDFNSGGLLHLNKPRDQVDPDTIITLELGSAGHLCLLDTKVGAEMYVVPQSELRELPALLALMGLSEMGLDPFRKSIAWKDFYELCNSSRAGSKTLKSFLSDENFVLGVGDLYSDEIMFHAGLSYKRQVSNLTPTEARRFYRALSSTLHDALKYRGASLYKRPFYDLFREPGTYQGHLEVFMRTDQLSSRGGTVVRARFSSRYTYYCDKTQLLEEV